MRIVVAEAGRGASHSKQQREPFPVLSAFRRNSDTLGDQSASFVFLFHGRILAWATHLLSYSLVALVAQIFLLCFVFSQVSLNLREFDTSHDFFLLFA